MSNSLFRKDAYGLYHYFEQVIEMRNDILNLNHARAQEIVTSKCKPPILSSSYS